MLENLLSKPVYLRVMGAAAVVNSTVSYLLPLSMHAIVLEMYHFAL